ncbi:CAP domain [Dillenia turbinata]|uniref:CAP domain n=1 Tax=Dillenia turbinata TaxID=194707 RepID=A0AAN8VZY7_9MAGN
MGKSQIFAIVILCAHLLSFTASAGRITGKTGGHSRGRCGRGRGSGYGKKVNIPGTETGFNAGSEMQQFLEAHNQVRILNKETLYQWDNTLAEFAKGYGSKLAGAGACKLVHSNGPYGENLFWGMGKDFTPTEAVKAWYDENNYYNPETNKCQPGQMCGHSTQIVWKDSTKLRCAK